MRALISLNGLSRKLTVIEKGAATAVEASLAICTAEDFLACCGPPMANRIPTNISPR